MLRRDHGRAARQGAGRGEGQPRAARRRRTRSWSPSTRPTTSIEGKRLSDLAAAAGLAPEEYALTLLEKDDAGLVSFNMSEDDIALIMRQPWTMTCTDGGLQPMTEGKPHPRAYGAFPRKLERYVRERASRRACRSPIRSMTALAAEVFGIKDRGVLTRRRVRRCPRLRSRARARSRPPTSSRISSPRASTRSSSTAASFAIAAEFTDGTARTRAATAAPVTPGDYGPGGDHSCR